MLKSIRHAYVINNSDKYRGKKACNSKSLVSIYILFLGRCCVRESKACTFAYAWQDAFIYFQVNSIVSDTTIYNNNAFFLFRFCQIPQYF